MSGRGARASLLLITAMLIGHVRSVHRYPVKSMAGEHLDSAEVALDGVLGDRAFALRDDRAGEIRGGKSWPRLMLGSACYRAEPTRAALPEATISLPDGTETSAANLEVSRKLSAWLEREVTLCPRMPAEDKRHYRRAQPGAAVAGTLARSTALRKVVARLAFLGPGGDKLRREFGRQPGEPLPDLSVFPAELFEYVSPPGTYFDAFPIHVITTATLAALRALHPAGDFDARRFRANFVVETSPELSGCIEQGWAGRVLRVGPTRFECTMPVPRCGMVAQAQSGLAKDASVLRTIVRETKQTLGIYARVLTQGRASVGDSVELE